MPYWTRSNATTHQLKSLGLEPHLPIRPAYPLRVRATFNLESNSLPTLPSDSCPGKTKQDTDDHAKKVRIHSAAPQDEQVCLALFTLWRSVHPTSVTCSLLFTYVQSNLTNATARKRGGQRAATHPYSLRNGLADANAPRPIATMLLLIPPGRAAACSSSSPEPIKPPLWEAVVGV